MTEPLRFKIEKLVYGGDGLGHAEGQTIFVPLVLPGEEILAEVVTRKKKMVKARATEIVQPSPERIAPPCAHFGTCGGCHYQHMPHATQNRLKEEILRETLGRLGGVTWTGAVTHHASPPFGYRNRAQWALRAGPPPSLGYFQPGSAEICEIKDCAVLSPALAECFAQLQTLVAAGGFAETLKEVEAFADSSDEKIAINAAFGKFPKSAADLAKLFRTHIPRLDSLLLNDQSNQKFELSGPGYLTHEAGGFKYRVSHLSFFQVNRFLVADLLETATRGASGDTALDLYGGVGFFALPLAKTFKKVICVDANLAATHDLRANAEAAGVTIQWHHEQVDDFLNRPRHKPDFVLLDPPRAGLGPQAAVKLAQLGAPEIVYLSCDPATLARDLAILTGPFKGEPLPGQRRYEIAEMHLFDLFPQTYHLETLVRLRLVP
jgi:23S rRNA (uracil1939-C5)-methyltransferase